MKTLILTLSLLTLLACGDNSPTQSTYTDNDDKGSSSSSETTPVVLTFADYDSDPLLTTFTNASGTINQEILCNEPDQDGNTFCGIYNNGTMESSILMNSLGAVIGEGLPTMGFTILYRTPQRLVGNTFTVGTQYTATGTADMYDVTSELHIAIIDVLQQTTIYQSTYENYTDCITINVHGQIDMYMDGLDEPVIEGIQSQSIICKGKGTVKYSNSEDTWYRTN